MGANAASARRVSRNKTSPGEVYLEFTQIGSMVRVSAVDAASGVEVSIAGPRNAPKAQLERVALAKLKYVLNKKKQA